MLSGTGNILGGDVVEDEAVAGREVFDPLEGELI
jgi:hypothetical protein